MRLLFFMRRVETLLIPLEARMLEHAHPNLLGEGCERA